MVNLSFIPHDILRLTVYLDVLKLAKDIGSKPEQNDIDNKEINSIMKQSDIVSRAIAKFTTGMEKDKLESMKK